MKTNKPVKPYDFDRLKSYSLWLLGRRDYSEKELRDKFLSKQAIPEDIEKAIIFLEEYGYVDDLKFTSNFINSAVNYKGHGPIRIRQELSRKGIPSDCASEALEDSDVDWVEQCRELRLRKYKKPPESFQEKQKQMAFLARRGFTMDTIFKAYESRDDE